MEKIILKVNCRIAEEDRRAIVAQLNAESLENDILVLPNYVDLIGVITDDADNKICIVNAEVIENDNEQ